MHVHGPRVVPRCPSCEAGCVCLFPGATSQQPSGACLTLVAMQLHVHVAISACSCRVGCEHINPVGHLALQQHQKQPVNSLATGLCPHIKVSTPGLVTLGKRFYYVTACRVPPRWMPSPRPDVCQHVASQVFAAPRPAVHAGQGLLAARGGVDSDGAGRCSSTSAPKQPLPHPAQNRSGSASCTHRHLAPAGEGVIAPSGPRGLEPVLVESLLKSCGLMPCAAVIDPAVLPLMLCSLGRTARAQLRGCQMTRVKKAKQAESCSPCPAVCSPQPSQGAACCCCRTCFFAARQTSLSVGEGGGPAGRIRDVWWQLELPHERAEQSEGQHDYHALIGPGTPGPTTTPASGGQGELGRTSDLRVRRPIDQLLPCSSACSPCSSTCWGGSAGIRPAPQHLAA